MVYHLLFCSKHTPNMRGSVPGRSFQEIYIFYTVNSKKTIDNMKFYFIIVIYK